MLPDEIWSGGFVGRTEELAVLSELFTQSRRDGAVVLIDGEPGIGRTRLLTELSGVARGAGVAVLSGMAAVDGTGVPYGLVADLLAGVGEVGPALANLHAQISLRAASVAAGGRSTSLINRDRLGRDLAALLGQLSGGGGLAVLVDDIHLADPQSVELLRHVVRRPPAGKLVLVLSCRSGRCPSALTAALNRSEARLVRITLAPLTEADLTPCLPDLPAERRRALFAAGRGNPRYLQALASAPAPAVAAINRGECPEQPLANPAADAVAEELRALPIDYRLALQAAAVIGCDVGIDALAYVAEEPEGALAEAIDALAERDVLRVVQGEPQFRHPVVRAVAYWLAGPAWRARAHARAADYLQQRGASLARRAPHLARCASLGDVPSAEALTAAAREVMGTAPATSLAWLQAASRILPGSEAAAHRHAALQTMRGRALILSGQFDDGTAVLREVTGVAGPHRVSAVEHLAQLERLLGRYAQARALLTTELPAAGTGHTQAMLRLELAASELFEVRYAPAVEHAYAALAIARRDGHRGIEAAGEAVVATCALGTRSLTQAVTRLDHAQSLFDALPDTELRDELGGLALLSWGQYVTARRGTAEQNIERGLRVARDYGREHALPQLLTVRSELRLADGRVAEALGDAQEAAALADSSGSAELRVLAASMGLRPRLWRDGTDAVRHSLAELGRHGAPHSAWFRAETATVLAEVHLALDDATACRAVLDATDGGALGTSGPPAATALTLRARATGDPAQADALLTAAERAAAGLPFYRGHVWAARGRLSLDAGHTARAVDYGRAAAADYAAAAVPMWEGQARMQLADCLRANGDIDAARLELGLAKGLFAAGGARWLWTRSGRAQRQLSATLPRGASDTTLTSRELQVAGLVTQGLTNSAIARELVLSDRTVETHLTRIFQRLGVRSRAGVAHWYTSTKLADSR